MRSRGYGKKVSATSLVLRDFDNLSLSAIQSEINDKPSFIKVHKEFELFVLTNVLPVGYTCSHHLQIYNLLKSLLPVFNPPKSKATSAQGLNKAILSALGSTLTSLKNLPFSDKSSKSPPNSLLKIETRALSQEIVSQLDYSLKYSIFFLNQYDSCYQATQSFDLLSYSPFWNIFHSELFIPRSAYLDHSLTLWCSLSLRYLQCFNSVIAFSQSKFNLPCPLEGLFAHFSHNLNQGNSVSSLIDTWQVHLNQVSQTSFFYKTPNLNKWSSYIETDSWGSSFYDGHNIADLLSEAFPWFINKSYAPSAIVSLKSPRTLKYIKEWATSKSFFSLSLPDFEPCPYLGNLITCSLDF